MHLDATAFARWAAPERPYLEALGRRLARNRDDAEDLVQETLLRAFVHRAEFQPGTNARAWLGRILRNLFLDQRRRAAVAARTAQSHAHEPEGDPTPSPESQVDRARARRRVRAAIAELPAPFRRAVEQVDLEGADYGSAARAEGCPEGTVMSRVARGRSRLREALAADPFGAAWIAA